MGLLEKLEQRISSWQEVSIHPHRFGGREFRFRAAEIGHVHTGGIVDIPFPRPVRDALIEDGIAEKHHWIPDSGWITFQLRSEHDLDRAIWLMRLSHLRYLLREASDAQHLLQNASVELGLSHRFTSLLEPFIRRSAKKHPVKTVSI